MPFEKGKSGNLAGRPKGTGMPEEVKEMLKAAGPKAIATLVEIATDKKASKRDRIRASEALADRAYGKATQPIDAEINGGFTLALSEELKKLAE